MKHKAVFLDRDGVINQEIGRYVSDIDDFVLNPGVLQAIRKLKQSGFLVIVITNQGGISRGLYTKEKLDCMHNILNEQLARFEIAIDEIYICPHHDKIEKCLCRKPNSLLLEKAITRFNIDVTQSVLIGDSERDIIAAERVGLKGIKVEPNGNLMKHISAFID
jgi:D-glycero-D-manno-heptose 1,7-bisphosphate phosphatase